MTDDITDRIPTAYSAALTSTDPACVHCIEQFSAWLNDNYLADITPDETGAAWHVWRGAFVSGYVTGAARIRAQYSPRFEFVHVR